MTELQLLQAYDKMAAFIDTAQNFKSKFWDDMAFWDEEFFVTELQNANAGLYLCVCGVNQPARIAFCMLVNFTLRRIKSVCLVHSIVSFARSESWSKEVVMNKRLEALNHLSYFWLSSANIAVHAGFTAG